MCEVRNKYLIAPDANPAEYVVDGETDIKAARARASDLFERDGVRRVIYVAVEVTTRDPSPVKFKPVDGVKESR